MPYYFGLPFTAAGSGKKKDQLTPTKNVETVSEQVQGVAQQPGVYTSPLFKKNACIHRVM